MSTKAQKRKSQLQSYAKRRARRPEATITPPVSLKVKPSVEKRMIRDHADLLQNVEFTLVNAANNSVEIDDHFVEQILRYAIKRKSSEDPIIDRAINLLTAICDLRSDVSEDVWRDALRVVYTSLWRHSSCEAGDTSYLHFVSQYVG